jgi:hypothetical protein
MEKPTLMQLTNNPKSRQNELVVQELKDEVLIYDLSINKAYCLNPTSAIIWNLCDGNNSVTEITKQLSKKLKQPVTNDLVYLALDQFKTDDLLSDNNEIEIKFDGLSRRDVIRKVGFASMIALPLISSLVAPTAAMAQSAAEGNLALFATCSTSSQCASGNCATSGSAANKCCTRTGTFKQEDGTFIGSYGVMKTCAQAGDMCTTENLNTGTCCSGKSYRSGCTDSPGLGVESGASNVQCTCGDGSGPCFIPGLC